MNGRIERFFGTFKHAIRHIQIDSKARLEQAIAEFTFFYNHIRLHQNLGNRTPEMAWRGQFEFPNEKTRDGLRAGTVSCAAGIGAGLLRDAIVRTLLIAVGGTLLVKHFGANTLADMPVK